MRKLRSVITGISLSVFMLSVFLLAIGKDVTASGVGTVEAAPADRVLQSAQTMAPSGVQVGLSALQRTTSYDMRDADRSKFDLPLLYLHREREGAAEGDRTLTINLSGLAGGTEIEVEVVSRHEDISTGGRR